MPVAVVIDPVTALLLWSMERPTVDLTEAITDLLTDRAGANKASVTSFRRDRGAPIGENVDEVVTVVIDPIADLGLPIRDTDIPITGVTEEVPVEVILATVNDLWTIITSIADPIEVFVELIWVRDLWAVIICATEAIIINIEADAAKRSLECEEREVMT